jgi:hypothetical protein
MQRLNYFSGSSRELFPTFDYSTTSTPRRFLGNFSHHLADREAGDHWVAFGPSGGGRHTFGTARAEILEADGRGPHAH